MKDFMKICWQWAVEHHVFSILFIVFSGVIICIYPQKECWLFIVLALFLLVEFVTCHCKPLQKFDRSISQSPCSYIRVAALTFVLVFDIIVSVNSLAKDNSNVASRTFIDMVSPISLREAIYNNKPDTMVTITTNQTVASPDSLSISVPIAHSIQKASNRRHELWLTVIFLAGLIVFTGILVASVNQFYAKRAERYRDGLTHYGFSHHILIVGADDIVISLVKHLLEKHQKKQIVIMTRNGLGDSRNRVDDFRKELFSQLGEDDRVVLQNGSQTSILDLEKMRPEKADELYIMGDYDLSDKDWSRHDADNITCLQKLKEIIEKKKASRKEGKKVDCYVMFENQSTFTAFQFSDFSNNLENVFHFVPFNVYEMIAQKTLICKSLDCKGRIIQPLEGAGINVGSDKHVHLVVMGMTPMGTALALTAAQLCHYPNYVRDKRLKTRITLIDHEADQQMNLFMGRYKDMFSVAPWRYIEVDSKKSDYFGTTDFESTPWKTISEEYFDTVQLGNDFVDIEWEFIKGGVELAEVHSYLRKQLNNDNTILTVAICVNTTHKAVAGSLYLPEEVYEKGLQVLVYQAENSSLIEMLANTKYGEKQSKRYQKIHAFGLEKDGVDLSQFDTTLAQTVNYVYSTVVYDSETDYGSADYTLAKMDDEKRMKEWTKEPTSGKTLAANQWSSIYAANTLWTKLRSVGWQAGDLSSEQVELLAEVEHNRWNVEQLIMNFRPRHRRDNYTSGKEMKINRVHPDLKEYDKLDEVTKKYDRAIVKALPYLYDCKQDSAVWRQ